MDNEVRKLGDLAFAESEEKRKVFDGSLCVATHLMSPPQRSHGTTTLKRKVFMSFCESKFPRVQSQGFLKSFLVPNSLIAVTRT